MNATSALQLDANWHKLVTKVQSIDLQFPNSLNWKSPLMNEVATTSSTFFSPPSIARPRLQKSFSNSIAASASSSIQKFFDALTVRQGKINNCISLLLFLFSKSLVFCSFVWLVYSTSLWGEETGWPISNYWRNFRCQCKIIDYLNLATLCTVERIDQYPLNPRDFEELETESIKHPVSLLRP